MEHITFDDIAQLTAFRKFCALAQRLFGVNIALASPDGRSASVFGDALNPFCVALQKHARGKVQCMECDRVHQREAQCVKGPVSYTCHAGLTDFVIPILYEGTIVAYLNCGQVHDHAPTAADWRRAGAYLSSLGISPNPLRQLFMRTHVLRAGMREDLISLLEIFATYVTDAGTRLLALEKRRISPIVATSERFMREHFREQVSLDMVAQAACTSPRNLTRVFLRETGVTMVDALTRLRVQAASEEVVDKRRNISEIAHDCGFGSVQQFNRSFRRVLGTTPRQWRTGLRSGKPRPPA